MSIDRKEVLAALCNWSDVTVSQGCADAVFVFGSLVYKGGAQLMPDKSDIDLVVQLPESAVGPEDRVARLEKIFERVYALEPTLLPLLKWSNASDPIVSVVPVTSFELRYGIHKSKQPNFFSSSDFIDLTNTNKSPSPLIAGDMNEFHNQHKVAISVVAAAQSYRNEYLSVSANRTRRASGWDGDDMIPKGIAREAAQLRYYVRQTDMESQFDINRGAMFVLEQLDDYREKKGGESINKLCDSVMARSGGRGERQPLSPDQQLLLWELLWQVAVDAVGKKNTTKMKVPIRQAAVLRLTDRGWKVANERQAIAFVAEAKWNITHNIENPFEVVVEKDATLKKLEAKAKIRPDESITRFELQKRERQLMRISSVLVETIQALMNSELLIRSVPSLESNLDSNVAAIKSALSLFDRIANSDGETFALVHKSGKFDTRIEMSRSDVVDVERWFMRPAHSILITESDEENLPVSRFPQNIRSRAVGRIIYVLVDYYARKLLGDDKELLNMNDWYVGVA